MLFENVSASDIVEQLELYPVVCTENDIGRACVVSDGVETFFENDLNCVGKMIFDRFIILSVVLFDYTLERFEKNRAGKPICARVYLIDYLFGLCSFLFLNYSFELAVS